MRYCGYCDATIPDGREYCGRLCSRLAKRENYRFGNRLKWDNSVWTDPRDEPRSDPHSSWPRFAAYAEDMLAVLPCVKRADYSWLPRGRFKYPDDLISRSTPRQR